MVIEFIDFTRIRSKIQGHSAFEGRRPGIGPCRSACGELPFRPSLFRHPRNGSGKTGTTCRIGEAIKDNS